MMMKKKKTTKCDIGIKNEPNLDKMVRKKTAIAKATAKLMEDAAKHNELKKVERTYNEIECLKADLISYFERSADLETEYADLLDRVKTFDEKGIKMGFEIDNFTFNSGSERADQKMMVILAKNEGIELPYADPKVDYKELEQRIKDWELGDKIVYNKTKPSFYVKGGKHEEA